MLQNIYGVPAEDFEQTRMIPIKSIYTDTDYKNEIKSKFKGLQIGNVDVKSEENSYLLSEGLET